LVTQSSLFGNGILEQDAELLIEISVSIDKIVKVLETKFTS